MLYKFTVFHKVVLDIESDSNQKLEPVFSRKISFNFANLASTHFKV